jgi:glycosyltransferase involved in cell wall biosynthesis
MNAPLVTVLITTYNYGSFIEEAIESVLSQDFPPDQMEVLVVDDGSTDDTAVRVKRYERVHYFYKPNGGQASAFNFGFARARGELIALLDADDYWLPGKLQRIVDEFQKDPQLGMVYHPFLEIDMATNTQTRSKTFIAISGSLFENPKDFFWYHPPGTSASFRRIALERTLPIPEGLRVQADGYICSLIIFVAPIRAIPEFLATYRFHDDNLYHADDETISHVKLRNRLELRRLLIEGMRKWLAANGFTTRQPAVRSFLDRWKLYQQSDEFKLEAPGRLGFFFHQLQYNRCYGPYLSRRIRAINYLNAVASFVTGYKHFPLLEKWRLRTSAIIRRVGTRSP